MFTCVSCGKSDDTIPYKCMGCHCDLCYKCNKAIMPQGHKKCRYCTSFEDIINYGKSHESSTSK